MYSSAMGGERQHLHQNPSACYPSPHLVHLRIVNGSSHTQLFQNIIISIIKTKFHQDLLCALHCYEERWAVGDWTFASDWLRHQLATHPSPARGRPRPSPSNILINFSKMFCLSITLNCETVWLPYQTVGLYCITLYFLNILYGYSVLCILNNNYAEAI